MPVSSKSSEGPDLPPRDLIDKAVWNSIINLPDDVSLRTSADHGTELKFMRKLWGSIIDNLGSIEDVMWHSLLDVADDACMQDEQPLYILPVGKKVNMRYRGCTLNYL